MQDKLLRNKEKGIIKEMLDQDRMINREGQFSRELHYFVCVVCRIE